MGDVMDSAGVPHFSGLRLDALRLSSSTPSSPSSAMASSYSGSPYNLSSPVAAAKKPFFIGTYPLLLGFIKCLIAFLLHSGYLCILIGVKQIVLEDN